MGETKIHVRIMAPVDTPTKVYEILSDRRSTSSRSARNGQKLSGRGNVLDKAKDSLPPEYLIFDVAFCANRECKGDAPEPLRGDRNRCDGKRWWVPDGCEYRVACKFYR